MSNGHRLGLGERRFSPLPPCDGPPGPSRPPPLRRKRAMSSSGPLPGPRPLGSSAGQQPRLHKVPVLPQDEEQQVEQDGGGHPRPRLHQRRDEVGQGGDEDQQHGHERQDDVDELAQQGAGVGVLHPLQLDHLLLLLLQLQLGDAGQARLHGFLRDTRTGSAGGAGRSGHAGAGVRPKPVFT